MFFLECLVSNGRQSLLWGIRLGGSTTYSISNFSLANDKHEKDSLKCTQDIEKIVEERKDIESEFYGNNIITDDLESGLQKTFGDTLNNKIYFKSNRFVTR